VRIYFSFCGAVALLGAAAPSHAALRVDPFVITVDQHSYTSHAWPVTIAPLEQLVVAPEALMANCRRANGAPLATARSRLIYTASGDNVNAPSLRIAFKPTRLVMQTEFGDVECDGAALAGETGIGRVFRDYFEQG